MESDAKINLEEIDKLLELARIEIPKEEEEVILNGMNVVLNYIEDLKKIEIKEVISQTKNIVHNLRNDEPWSKSEKDRDFLIGSFRKLENEKLSVPSILDKTK